MAVEEAAGRTDSLLVPDDDQTVIVYSARPGSREASSLALLRTTGIQQMGHSTT